MDLTYIVPIKPTRPFRKGDVVLVLTRQGHRCENPVTVMRAGPRVVVTDCGRRWNQAGYWLGDRPYPFPWIMRKDQYERHIKKHGGLT